MAIQISQQDFIKIYVRHQPNKFTKFMYKNFGVTNNDKLTGYQWLLLIIFVIFNVLGFFTRIIPIVLFPNIVLGVVVISGFIAVFMNNSRIKKICKELNISRFEFNMYSSRYMKNK